MEITSYYELYESTICKHYENIKNILDCCNATQPEGNCFYFHKTTTEFKELICKRANILYYAKDCKKICEIGFNAGHSAILLHLTSAKDADIVYFDIKEHNYVESCYNYITSAFTQNAIMHYGDSQITIPEFLRQNPSEMNSFDLIHVDGNHEELCFLNDISNAMKMIKPGGIIIIDDTQVSFISDWVKQSVKNNSVEIIDLQLPTIGYMHTVVKRKI